VKSGLHHLNQRPTYFKSHFIHLTSTGSHFDLLETFAFFIQNVLALSSLCHIVFIHLTSNGRCSRRSEYSDSYRWKGPRTHLTRSTLCSLHTISQGRCSDLLEISPLSSNLPRPRNLHLALTNRLAHQSSNIMAKRKREANNDVPSLMPRPAKRLKVAASLERKLMTKRQRGPVYNQHGMRTRSLSKT